MTTQRYGKDQKKTHRLACGHAQNAPTPTTHCGSTIAISVMRRVYHRTPPYQPLNNRLRKVVTKVIINRARRIVLTITTMAQLSSPCPNQRTASTSAFLRVCEFRWRLSSKISRTTFNSCPQTRRMSSKRQIGRVKNAHLLIPAPQRCASCAEVQS